MAKQKRRVHQKRQSKKQNAWKYPPLTRDKFLATLKKVSQTDKEQSPPDSEKTET